MNKTNKMILGLMLGTLVVGCQKDYYLDDLQAAQEEITRLKTTVKGLQNNLDSAEYQNSNLLAQLNAASDALSTAQGVNIELTANINTLSDIISDLETQINELNTEINNLSANDQANQDVIASLNEEIAALQTEIDNYEPVIVEVIREVEVIVERVVEVHVDTDEVEEVVFDYSTAAIANSTEVTDNLALQLEGSGATSGYTGTVNAVLVDGSGTIINEDIDFTVSQKHSGGGLFDFYVVMY